MAGGAGALGLVELGVQDVLCGVDLGVGVLREVHRTLVRLQRLLSLHGPKNYLLSSNQSGPHDYYFLNTELGN